jgi:hypothetical protein
LMFFRLWVRAPLTMILSIQPHTRDNVKKPAGDYD